MKRKWVVVSNESEFSQVHGVYDDFYTALGRAYDFLFDAKGDMAEVPPPIFDEGYKTGFYINAGDDERPFVVMILIFDETDKESGSKNREQIIEWHKVGDALPPAGEPVLILFNDGSLRYAWQDWARNEKSLDRYHSDEQPDKQIYPLE